MIDYREITIELTGEPAAFVFKQPDSPAEIQVTFLPGNIAWISFPHIDTEGALFVALGNDPANPEEVDIKLWKQFDEGDPIAETTYQQY